MSERWRGILILLGIALMAGLGFLGARFWQSMDGYTRVSPVTGCDLRAGPCSQPLDGGLVTFSIEPREIPLMQPLRLRVQTDGVPAHAIAVEIRGLNMDMGLNRTLLTQTITGRWEGETILPVCSQRRMEWEAAVRLDAGAHIEVPFPFHTTRP